MSRQVVLSAGILVLIDHLQCFWRSLSFVAHEEILPFWPHGGLLKREEAGWRDAYFLSSSSPLLFLSSLHYPSPGVRASQHHTHAGTCWLCMPARARARTGKWSHMQRWRLALEREGKQLEMILHLHYNGINSTGEARWGCGGFFKFIYLFFMSLLKTCSIRLWGRKRKKKGRSPCHAFGLLFLHIVHRFKCVFVR